MGDSFSISEGSGFYSSSQTSGRPSAELPQPTNKKDAVNKTDRPAPDPERTPEPVEPVNFKNSRYQIKLDGETGQVFTDIVDPATDAVVGRIPSYFKPSDEATPGGNSTEIGTTDKRTVTI